MFFELDLSICIREALPAHGIRIYNFRLCALMPLFFYARKPFFILPFFHAPRKNLAVFRNPASGGMTSGRIHSRFCTRHFGAAAKDKTRRTAKAMRRKIMIIALVGSVSIACRLAPIVADRSRDFFCAVMPKRKCDAQHGKHRARRAVFAAQRFFGDDLCPVGIAERCEVF